MSTFSKIKIEIRCVYGVYGRTKISFKPNYIFKKTAEQIIHTDTKNCFGPLPLR